MLTFAVSNVMRFYLKAMIISFKDKETEKIWNGTVSLKLPIEIQQTARRKLRMINNSQNINDLRIPPGNRLEKLQGDLKNHYSIRINDQWRIVFCWDGSHSSEVKIDDYH
jgi:proteic killer suppression protein